MIRNTARGVIGRNFSYQDTSGANCFFDGQDNSIPSSPRALSGCASMTSTAIISITVR